MGADGAVTTCFVVVTSTGFVVETTGLGAKSFFGSGAATATGAGATAVVVGVDTRGTSGANAFGSFCFGVAVRSWALGDGNGMATPGKSDGIDFFIVLVCSLVDLLAMYPGFMGGCFGKDLAEGTEGAFWLLVSIRLGALGAYAGGMGIFASS